MNKKLNSTFCTLAVTAMVSVAMLSGCSGTTAAPGASDTDQASTTAVAGGDKSMGEASMEAENTDAGIESKDTDGQKLKVMASFYPMYDFAVKIGGDKAEVTNMVPAGTEPHDWKHRSWYRWKLPPELHSDQDTFMMRKNIRERRNTQRKKNMAMTTASLIPMYGSAL